VTDQSWQPTRQFGNWRVLYIEKLRKRSSSRPGGQNTRKGGGTEKRVGETMELGGGGEGGALIL